MQEEYNEKNGITPQTIIKEVANSLEISVSKEANDKISETLSPEELDNEIARLDDRMKQAAMALEFELAAALRDEMILLSGKLKGKKKKR